MISNKVLLFIIVFLVLTFVSIDLFIFLNRRGGFFGESTSVSTKSPPSEQLAVTSSLYNFSGTITDVSGNNFTIKTLVGDPKLPPQKSAPKPILAVIAVSSSTELSSFDPTQKIVMKDLKKGMQVQIYASPNLDYKKPIQALKIIVMTDVPPLATVSAKSASNSASTSAALKP